MKKYESAGIDEKLYNSELKILENEDFDNQIAGIVLLGKEMSKICSGKAHKYIKKIIHAETSEKSSFNLVQDMVNYSRDDFDRILYLLLKLGEGINYCI